ncbi:MAG: aminotransferase class I/II-fold pyridoxal phosphate-dependent enzyme [Kiritimatiellae bacterium]|nr:aminotransferase class I/II-fold pyridoxal phosphate-dependent enzyme [Kiritimatiellia bacterium]
MNGSKSARSRIASYLSDIPRSGIREFFDIVSTQHDIISLGIGEPDFVTPWHIREGAIFALERGATSYTSNFGLIRLRRAIAAYLERVFGVAYDPETEILITVGVSEAFDLAVRAVTQPGDDVLYHEPCYVSYSPIITLAHGNPIAVATRREDDFRLLPPMLEQRITPRTRTLVLNFPTNPTGATLQRADVEALAAFAEKHDLTVITDEIYSELTYDGDHASIAAMPGMKDRTLFLHGFSKAWAMTGFRLGYACGPADLVEAMMKIHQYTMLCAPILSQEAALEALSNPDIDVEEMKSAYQKRRNFIHKALSEMGLPCHRPRGAFYAFPFVGDLGLSSRDFALRLLQEKKVACVPGDAFGSSGEGYIRCSYATEMEEIKEAMSRMAEFIAGLR